MLEACDPDAVQTPAGIVAPDLVLDSLVAKKAAYLPLLVSQRASTST